MDSHGRGLWVERLTLTDFRNYASMDLAAGPEPQIIAGTNGAGKTALLEAISLLAPGQGLRRAPFPDLARAGGGGGFAVASHAHTLTGPADIGTGLVAGAASHARTGRTVRIGGATQSGSGVLADYLEIVWLTPAMDGLFTGAASERRRFLDRLILCFDPAYRSLAARFERAMTNRNKLLESGTRDDALLTSFEVQMAETGVAVAAQRLEAVAAMAAVVARRRDRDPQSAFPWAQFALDGALERDLATGAAIEAEDRYQRILRAGRERDRAAGRTLDGPHRSDFTVEHGPKAMPAKYCSTGEQKALLIGLVLAHAELLRERQEGAAPILLLDEITAHLDQHRRSALFAELLRLGAQAWMSGTDISAFDGLGSDARRWVIEDGKATG